MQAAFNIGNAMGAFLGGLVIDAGFGYASPALVALVLALLGSRSSARPPARTRTAARPSTRRSPPSPPAQRRRRVRASVEQ